MTTAIASAMRFVCLILVAAIGVTCGAASGSAFSEVVYSTEDEDCVVSEIAWEMASMPTSPVRFRWQEESDSRCGERRFVAVCSLAANKEFALAHQDARARGASRGFIESGGVLQL